MWWALPHARPLLSVLAGEPPLRCIALGGLLELHPTAHGAPVAPKAEARTMPPTRPQGPGDLHVALAPYVPGPGGSCQEKEYYEKDTQMCCSKCPPGHHVQFFCTRTSDTVCEPCKDSTYTQLWNWLSQCLTCDSRCASDQVETQACTREKNRICTCEPSKYCTLPRQGQEGCRLCAPHRKCPPGKGVATPGSAGSDVVCAACAPGTFSDTYSSTDACRPHQSRLFLSCRSVAIPGDARRDAVCGEESAPFTSRVTLGAGPVSLKNPVSPTNPASPTPQPESTTSQPREPTPTPTATAGPSLTASTSPLLPLGPSPPMEGIITGNISLPVGLIVGVTALGLLIIGLLNCIILTQKRKKPFCLQGEAKVPHLPADKARGAPGLEQQHLLTTAPSSSSSSLESSAPSMDKGHAQAPGAEWHHASWEARANSRGAEPSPGGHGTQVNVTCIVNVCSGSDHGSQRPSQTGSAAGDSDASCPGSPKDEQVPLSKEECAFQSQSGALETLLQELGEKPLPLGVPDAGMKPS
ncbi:Tumor necrosis factor receptor superfamily member 1B [Galemys pyrenaicus]|uniref:Tumor necrosis factor receptor superfamily member 1B n=1 Tax=Galemys pyrenaicus TaxID=202257 RepID=A0A8J6A5K5_GALPY|nr:Tumor necrosis factor receptor superfamily member 1B [Galemys pyrenaicus]